MYLLLSIQSHTHMTLAQHLRASDDEGWIFIVPALIFTHGVCISSKKKHPGWRSCSCPFLIYMYFILWFGPSFCGFYLPATLYLAKRLLKTRLH